MTYQIFKSSVIWNTINVCLYKIILQAHQACLFYVISKELFGISATYFSALYLAINLTNFGFDYSLFAFNPTFVQSKKHFSILVHHLLKRAITLLCTGAALALILQGYISPALLALLCIIFISESLKKTLELVAQLSFLSKAVTLAEISMLLVYVTTIWVYFWLHGSISLITLFAPLLLTSTLELVIIALRLKTLYQNLPENAHTPVPSKHTLAYNQRMNYLNQIAKALFSPNFIIMFLAYHLGMIKVGYIKLAIDSIILMYVLLHKAVGISSAAYMSQDGKHATQKFVTITNGYIQFLYILVSVILVTLIPCLGLQPCTPNSTIINILFFACTGFLEFILITYEKLFLTQNRPQDLASINAISILCLALTLPLCTKLPLAFILLPLLIIRLGCIVATAHKAWVIWQVWPKFTPNPRTFFAALLMAFSLSLKRFLGF
jgi:hypothetical protein